MTESYTKVAKVDELKPGKGMGVEVNGIEIALFNVDGDYHALSNRCPHQRAPICKSGKKLMSRNNGTRKEEGLHISRRMSPL